MTAVTDVIVSLQPFHIWTVKSRMRFTGGYYDHGSGRTGVAGVSFDGDRLSVDYQFDTLKVKGLSQ